MRVLFAKEKTTGFLRGLPRTGFKTDFVAKSSEKPVVKAGGGKGSEACWSTSRTFFTDNADPRISQPIAAGSSFEISCSHSFLYMSCPKQNFFKEAEKCRIFCLDGETKGIVIRSERLASMSESEANE